MADAKSRYIRMLKIELDDLRDDLQVLIDDCCTREKRHESTHYVCMENMAVFKREILDVNTVDHILDRIEVDEYADVDALARALDDRFGELARRHGITDAVYSMLRRRLEKLAGYIGASPE